jgi:hypothetical protein
MNTKAYKRCESDLPLVTSNWGWRYHHLGIPTSEKRTGEKYLEQYKLYVSGFERSPFGIEWMRFDHDSPISELVQRTPHLAFEVDDLAKALVDKEVLLKPTELYPGARVAMIISDGAPVELLEFTRDSD